MRNRRRFLVCACLALAVLAPVGWSATPAGPGPAAIAAGGYALRVMPLRHESSDPAARSPVEGFHAQLIHELGKVPGIVLLSADDETARGGVLPLYELVVASLPVARLANGAESYGSLYEANRRGSYTPMSGMIGTQWPLEIRVLRDGRLAPAMGNRDAIVHLAREGAPRHAICAQELRSQSGASLLCLTSAQLAEFVADRLRLQVLPPDRGMYDKLVGRIRDGSLSERQRSIELNLLLMALGEGRYTNLDASGAQAIVTFARSASPGMRGTIWRLLRGDPDAEFVGPMIDSLRGEVDQDTRLEALTTLAEDHGSEPRVRAAIGQAAREDPLEFNRMVARRALGDETEWGRYVIATLRDSSLSAWERTVPLFFEEQRMQSPQQSGRLAGLVRMPGFTDALLAAARETRAVTDVGQRGTMRRSLNLLIRYGDPAVLARHADWADLQSEFSTGPPRLPVGLDATIGAAPVTAGEAVQ